MKVTKEMIEDIIKQQKDHFLGVDLISAGCVKSVEVREGSSPQIQVDIVLGFYAKAHSVHIKESLEALIAEKTGQNALVNVSTKVVAHKVQGQLHALPNVKNIIAVASGKGGVGKSTTSVNLALSLMNEGAKVGILDADIYGPSLPTMLNSHEKPKSIDGKSMEPVEAQGLQTNSIGYLIADRDAAIWRAPMAVSALAQMLKETNWKDLDYLIVDMPPGTGDIQLTLAQQVPVAGSVIVTTPQDIALLDARKGITMFEKVGIPILGIVENMSYHICSNCGHEEAIFGTDGGKELAEKEDITLLGRMPLNRKIREELDNGQPTATTGDDLAKLYQEIAIKTAAILSLRERDRMAGFPKVVVQQSQGKELK
ncbi:iron-sulfur cluster carrier protein ApbC [Ignatzschineria sp. LJL83]